MYQICTLNSQVSWGKAVESRDVRFKWLFSWLERIWWCDELETLIFYRTLRAGKLTSLSWNSFHFAHVMIILSEHFWNISYRVISNVSRIAFCHAVVCYESKNVNVSVQTRWSWRWTGSRRLWQDQDMRGEVSCTEPRRILNTRTSRLKWEDCLTSSHCLTHAHFSWMWRFETNHI